MPTKAREYFTAMPPVRPASSATSAVAGGPQTRKPLPFKPPRPSGEAGARVTKAKAKTTGTRGRGGGSKGGNLRGGGVGVGARVVVSTDDEEEEEEEEEGEDGSADDEEGEEDGEGEGNGGDVYTTASSRRQISRHGTTNAHQNTSLLEDEDDEEEPLAHPSIPPKLLTRLLFEAFEDKEMKIGREAMQVVGKYMETFVREALARAAFEREDGGARGGGAAGDGWLQVEDLEKLAPGLVLDF